ncbi:RtcB family protein [Candidatus Pacearchaeota archaeon]|nr:RtcB family protein [Candidatus Pacearchaeota archaeon]
MAKNPDIEEVKKVSENIYRVEKTGKMSVPVIIYASEKLLKEMKKDNCIQQMKNVACLPGIEKNAIVLPDAHLGYGFCIGGVAAFDIDKGVISPGGVGYDISCSVRLLKTNLKKQDIEKKQKEIAKKLYNKLPTGVGKGGKVRIDKKEIKEIMKKGSLWAVENGYGIKEDCELSEEQGCMKDAEPEFVSERAIARGINQLGSLGSGNHFLEVQYVENILDEKTAEIFGLEMGQVCIMIHCGSRGLGHQIASDYIKLMEEEYGFENIPDRQLICAPIKSELGQKYYKGMCCAANFAFCNKQVLTHFTREIMKEFFPNFKAEVVYDVCHNIAKFEEHEINGVKKMLCVHRKGATRSLGKGRKEIPEKYLTVGQPIIIPGSMGTSSYILVGTENAEKLSFASTAHGAGRIMSRFEAMRTLKVENIKNEMEKNHIEVSAGSWKSLVEESPNSYKDVDEVVRVSDEVRIGKIVAKLKPMVVVKG